MRIFFHTWRRNSAKMKIQNLKVILRSWNITLSKSISVTTGPGNHAYWSIFVPCLTIKPAVSWHLLSFVMKILNSIPITICWSYTTEPNNYSTICPILYNYNILAITKCLQLSIIRTLFCINAKFIHFY